MRKWILTLMLAFTVVASGCGADNTAQKTAEEAAKMKNEAQQTLDKATEDANRMAENANQKISQIANEADKKVEHMSNSAENIMDSVQNETMQRIQNLAKKMMQASEMGNITAIDQSKMSIGGIIVGATKSAVRNVYGEPNDIKSASIPEGNLETWYYGDSLELQFLNDKIYSISVTKPNGLKTPDGISVGDSKEELNEKYGSSIGNDVIFYTTPNHAANIGFGVDNDKITSINIYMQQ